MRVVLADKAGFCFGVSRAVDTVYREIESGRRPVYTYGPIIHNEEVISDLEKRGVRVIDSLEEIEDIDEGTVIIRSHGVSGDIMERIEGSGLAIVDATCPFVGRIHGIVENYSEKGYFVLIAGSPDHPEVEGIVGRADPDRCRVISCAEEARDTDVSGTDRICIVAQTTFNHKKFQDIVEIIQKKAYDKHCAAMGDIELVVCNTICSATMERQDAARELSRQADAMIVVGGSSSSNTRKLYEICLENCNNTYFIQTKEDLEAADFSGFDCVGITAGASTPKNIIEEVQKYVRE